MADATAGEAPQQQQAHCWKQHRLHSDAEDADVSRACWLGDIQSLQLSIAQGTDMTAADSNGTTPMGFACGYGREHVVALLVAANVSVDSICARHGERPVHRAARFGHLRCTELLIAAGADLTLVDDKEWSAVHHAAGRGHSLVLAAVCGVLGHNHQLAAAALRTAAQYGKCDCVRVLLSFLDDVDRVNDRGCSALWIGASWGHENVVACLLDAMADPLLQDNENRSAVEAAAERGYTRCVQGLGSAAREDEPMCVRVCVQKARLCSNQLAIVEATRPDTQQQLTLLFDSRSTVDCSSEVAFSVHTLIEKCKLPKSNRLATGVYIDAWVQEERSGVAVVQILNLEVETHAHWEQRVSRHGSDATRFAAFAAFVVEELQLPEGATVLDVAGGQGRMACELVRLGVKHVVIVDPADHAGAAANLEQAAGTVSVIQEPLDSGFCDRHPGLLDTCDAVVGLHPDEATDLIVHLGLEWQLPLAVVPCCVFPKLFARKRRSGQGVVSCNGLVEYLLELEPDQMKSQLLPFEGANRVVYSVQRQRQQ